MYVKASQEARELHALSESRIQVRQISENVISIIIFYRKFRSKVTFKKCYQAAHVHSSMRSNFSKVNCIVISYRKFSSGVTFEKLYQAAHVQTRLHEGFRGRTIELVQSHMHRHLMCAVWRE